MDAKQNIDNDFLKAIARLCYVDCIPQRIVAEMFNISQAKVSRLLNLARERGIVRIEVSDYNPRCVDVENELKKRFGLQDVIVLKTVDFANTEKMIRQVGYFGSEQIARYLLPNMTVGISGGRTLMYVVDELQKKKTLERLTVVQLMGNVGAKPYKFDSSELGRKLSANNSVFLALNTPIFVRDKMLKKKLLAHKQLKSVMKLYSQIDVALVGIGTLESSIFTTSGVITKQEFAELRQNGAVGEICGHFFDREGRECKSILKDCVISIELKVLRKIPKIFAVVCSGEKRDAILGAIRGRFINSLLIDDMEARKLLECKL